MNDEQRPRPDAERAPDDAPVTVSSDREDGLLGRVEVIEAQPLAERARGFEQLHDELLAELQRGDRGEQ